MHYKVFYITLKVVSVKYFKYEVVIKTQLGQMILNLIGIIVIGICNTYRQ